jgi:hypothetical protein
MIGFSVNMVTAEEKGKVKVLTSARAKQDGSVDPAQQVTVEQVHKEVPRILKSQIEVGESFKSKPRVTSCILLNKWQRQQEKERYQKQNTRRRSEDMKKKCTGKNEKSMHESKSVRIGDVCSSGTARMKV